MQISILEKSESKFMVKLQENMSSLQMICVCMQVELPKISHFKNDEQNFIKLSHMDMPGQEGSDVTIKNPPQGCSPSTQSE